MAAIAWRKSSRSGSNGGTCVELAALPGGIGARDSKNPGGAILVFRAAEMRAFLGRIRDGEHDLKP